ncbi:hypothetical protein [Vreelandella sp. GE22]
MKIILSILFVVILTVLGVWLMDIATDQAKVVEISAPVSAYTDWECGYSNKPGCSVIFEIITDAEYDVQRIQYGKDFMAIKIQQGGVSGWVFYGKAVRIHAGSNT